MRAAAACQFSLSNFGLWRVAILSVTALASGSLIWGAASQEAFPRFVAIPLFALATLLVWGMGRSMAKVEPVNLRWDGARWYLGPTESLGSESVAGNVRVSMDLGPWLLIRFDADPAGNFSFLPRVTWLPIQRRGSQTEWHALRCALYSRPPERHAGSTGDL